MFSIEEVAKMRAKLNSKVREKFAGKGGNPQDVGTGHKSKVPQTYPIEKV